MMWDVSKAVAHLRSHAFSASTGNCARAVREAIQAGGIRLTPTHSAKDYGARLESAGFRPLPDGMFPRAGDVVIIQPIPNHPHGHMAMYDGHLWISDFRQYHGYYPGPSYRTIQPPCKFYRHP
ncbi:cytoplasmic protein [Pantoea stewartii subsp. stewartii DC283]|uniref:Cytoplasmic protein n=1 Tax=Pantoea stewartii subsp. stewartii DC283 TaxID=660596 RepID=A0ABM6KAD1_PANSE|nr:cytoplasmic protein [Pantoea stewartii subsp. stewartii DC283]